MKNLLKLICAVFCISITSCATAQNSTQTSQKTEEIAERMLVYQLKNGGWPKQLMDQSVVNYQKPIDDALMVKIKATTELHATIDNKATSREVNALVKAYKNTNNKTYLAAAEKGIEYLFKAQYANGGWPQYFPDHALYRGQITYNDDAMINVLTIMQNIVAKTNDFDSVNPEFITKAENAIKKGIECILKTQITVNGKLSIWGAQYDQNTLKPAKARNFEPVSLSTSESVGIIRFLMKLKNPSPAIKTAVSSAVAWFVSAKITGYKFEKMANGDKGLVADENSVIWARFYDLTTSTPIFGDRDNSVKTDVSQISFERRNGYAWYGIWGLDLITKDYPKWLKNNP